MLSSSLQRWQQDNSFRVGGDAVYGVHRSVGFSVVDEDGGKLFVFMLSGADSAFDNCEDMLAQERGDLKLVQVGDVENYLALFFDESAGEMSSGSMTALLDFVADSYRTCGFRAPNICVKCGAPATKRSFYNKMVQPMCAACRDAEKQNETPRAPAPAHRPEPEEDRSVPLASGKSHYDDSYDEYAGMEHSKAPLNDRPYNDYDERPRRRGAAYNDYYEDDRPVYDGSGSGGFIGALLGSIAGLVPYFVSVLIPFELSALCFAAGLGATIGYGAFGGKKNKQSAVGIVILVSLVLSLLAVTMVGVFTNYAGTFGETMSTLFSSIWLNLVFALIGNLLGVAVSYDKLIRYIRQ